MNNLFLVCNSKCRMGIMKIAPTGPKIFQQRVKPFAYPKCSLSEKLARKHKGLHPFVSIYSATLWLANC
jgi:hypothetical protein